MSTKTTLAHGDGWHFYTEAMDDDNVYLDTEGEMFGLPHSHSMTIAIPVEIWAVMRTRGEPHINYAEKTDEELEKECQEFVDERLEKYNEILAKGGKPGLIAVWGCLGYGTADEPVEDQMRQGLEHLKQTREEHKIRKARIDALMEKNKGNPGLHVYKIVQDEERTDDADKTLEETD